MKEEYTLSIIVPLYNSSLYIADCLDSILSSDLPKDKYEIVVVNDGSTDNGPDIVKHYLATHCNIRIVNQDNQGLSGARNTGIRNAKGSYFWCVDSDDLVEKNIARILPFLDGKTDIVSTYLKLIREDGSLVSYSKDKRVPYNKIVSGRSVVIAGYNPTSVCGHFVKKQFVMENDLFFVPNRAHEDVEMSYKLFSFARKVIFLDLALYIYILHPNSMSQSKVVEQKLKLTLDDIFVYNSFIKLAEKFADSDPELSTIISKRAESALFGILATLYNNKEEWGRNGINKAVLAELRKQKLYPLKGPFYTKKHSRMRYILNIPIIYYPLWVKKR